MRAVLPSADRNLLFGVLALQMEFVTRDGLVAGMHAWALEKEAPLGEILVRQGALRADLRGLLEAIVDRRAELHDDEAGPGLADYAGIGGAGRRPPADARADALRLMAEMACSSSPVADPAATCGVEMATRGVVGQAAATRFQVLRPHAKGGLGEVFVARDAEANREVALKEILPHAAADPDARARFLFEAEVTAGLEHPGVVPVYGLGTYPDGRPYYAMRFIRGDSLAEAIGRFHGPAGRGLAESERNLELRRLLGRFVSVCQTIAYAHNRGVLHRDLKPGNVMLGRHGETLVVDWGLAKVIGRPDSHGPASRGGAKSGTATNPGGSGLDEAALSPATSGIDEPALVPSSGGSVPTMAGRLLGTPAYMSPEQAEGRLDLVGPASDIYGLGASFYQLLTGRTPVDGNDLGEMLRQIRTGEFPSPRAVTPAVPKALDAICLKALALRPGDRYASAAEMAADIERYLADEPVAALPEGRFDRWGRWARRNRTAVRTGMVAALVLFTGVFVAERWYQEERSRRATEAAARAADERALAKEAREDVVEAIEEAGELRDAGRWKAARTVLASARRRLKAAADPGLAERVRLADLGVTAAEGFEEARLDTAVWRDGEFDLASAIGRNGSYAAVFGSYLRGLGVRADFWDGDPAEVARALAATDIAPQVVAALDAWSWREGTRSAENERRILDLARRVDPDPVRARLRDPAVFHDGAALAALAAEFDWSRSSGVTVNALANRLRRVGRTAEATDLWRRGTMEHPTDLWLHLNLGMTLWKDLGRAEEAAGHFEVAVAVRPMASVYENLGAVLSELDRPAEAEAAFRKAVRLDPDSARAHLGLGDALRELGRVEEADAETRRAVELDGTLATVPVGLGGVEPAEPPKP